MTTLLDTSVVVALLAQSDRFHAWAVEKFQESKTQGPTVISDIVYCEASIAMNSQAHTDEAIALLGVDRILCSDAALFRAGRAFKKYREDNKGPKLGVLPDFFIGAVAEVEGLTLLTTNPRDYAGYFPTISLVTPSATLPVTASSPEKASPS